MACYSCYAIAPTLEHRILRLVGNQEVGGVVTHCKNEVVNITTYQ